MNRKKKKTKVTIVPKKLGNFYLETDIEFCHKRFFGDNQVHLYDCKCYDGYAECTKQASDESNAPLNIVLTYPTLAEVKSNPQLAHAIREYRGLYNLTIDDLHYGDVMMYLGKPQQVQNA
jgi:hypothetical protein